MDLSQMSDAELEAKIAELEGTITGIPTGATPRPEYGEGAYQTEDGMIMRGKQILKGAQTAPAADRTRLTLGLGPTIEAQKNLYAEESGGTDRNAADDGNPLSSIRGMAAGVINTFGRKPTDPPGPVRTTFAKKVGGQSVQNYEQAAKSFEAAFMPILSGAAVTESEAQRMIKASLPEPGDSMETLNRKAKNRAMMINGAAKLMGQPPPFPQIPSMDFSGKRTTATPTKKTGGPMPAVPAKPAQAKRLVYDPATGTLK